MIYCRALLILSIILTSLGAGISQKTILEADHTPTKTGDFLAGLTKANPTNKAFFQKKVAGDSIPLYLPSGERIQGEEMTSMLINSEFVPEPYINQENQIEAFVLKKTTANDSKIRELIFTMKEHKSDLVGKKAPLFYAHDLYGVEHSLSNLRDKIVVLNFWFIACKPCVKEIPALNQLVKKYADKDVLFIGFANNKRADLENFLHKNDFNYHIVHDSREIAKSYEILTYPTHIIIDKNSTIKLALSGGNPTTIEQVDQEIERLLQQE